MKKLILIILPLFIAACSTPAPVATATQVDIVVASTGMPVLTTETATPTAVPLTDTPSSTSTELRPVATPRPTLTPLPALQPGRPVGLTALHMMSDIIGWGIEVDGHIVRTPDGGISWKDVTPPEGAYDAGGFFALDANMAWATPFCIKACRSSSRQTAVWHTSDGGQTWQPKRICSSEACDYDVHVDYHDTDALQFLDQKNGWLEVSTGYNMGSTDYRIYKTMDGGITWVMMPENSRLAAVSVHGIAFVVAQTGWLGISQVDGRFQPGPARWTSVETIDGGASWHGIDLPPPADYPASLALESLCGIDKISSVPPDTVDMTFRCVGYDSAKDSLPGAQYYFYYHSPDGGQTWRSWQAGIGEHFVNSRVGWRMVSSGPGQPNQLQKTVDAGRSWVTIKSVPWQDVQFDFASEQVGWAVVTLGDLTALVHTSNSGRTWSEIKPVVAP